MSPLGKMDRAYICPRVLALRSCPSLSSQCLAAPILVAKATMPPNSWSSVNLDFYSSIWTMQPEALAPPPLPQGHTTQPPQVEQHSPHSSPSSPTLSLLNPEAGGQSLLSHLQIPNLLCRQKFPYRQFKKPPSSVCNGHFH